MENIKSEHFKAVSPFGISEITLHTKHQDYISDEVYLKLNNKKVKEVFEKKRDYITMSIPVSNTESFQLELMKVNILSDDFKVTTSEGDVMYSGQVNDHAGLYVLYNDKNLKVDDSFSCGVTDEIEIEVKYEDKSKKTIQEKSMNGNCVNVYIETDFYTYVDFGSDINAVTNFITALFNEVSTLYVNEMINVQISEIYIWTVSINFVEIFLMR